MKIYIILSLFFIISCGSGCATHGFVKEDFRASLGVEKLEVDDQEIGDILNKKRNLPKPFKLGVYFQNKKYVNCSESKFHEEDKTKVLNAVRDSMSEEDMSNIFVINDRSLPSRRGESFVKRIRRAGAWYGADAVMIVRNHVATDTRYNSLAASYWLIAPMFFMPGTDIHVLSAMDSTIYDVRNGFFYAGIESEGGYDGKYIAAYGSKECKKIKVAKEAAIGSMVDRIKLYMSEKA